MNTEKVNTKKHADDQNKGSKPAAEKKERSETPKRKSWLKRMIRFFLYFVVFLLLLLSGIWIWSGGEGSLAKVISLTQRFVPIVESSLQVEKVEGSIRHGGRIGLLRWQQEGIDVEVTDLSLDWDLSALMRGHLNVEHITATQVLMQIEPEEAEPFTMPELPENFAIPVRVDLNKLKVDSFIYGAGEEALKLENVEANYHYDHLQHQLGLVSLHFDRGDYRAKALLTATNPRLNLQLDGMLQAPVGDGEPVQMDVNVGVQGELRNLLLKAQAHANVLPVKTAGENSDPAKEPGADTADQATTEQSMADKEEDVGEESATQMLSSSASLEVQATLWDAEIVPFATLDFQEFNLGALLSTAPQTMLSGMAKMTGLELGGALGVQGFKLETDIENSIPGTLDAPAIPIAKLLLNASLEGQKAEIESLEIQMTEGGVISATGDVSLPENFSEGYIPLSAQMTVELTDLNPQIFLSTLYSDRVNGHVTIDHGPDGLSYEARLKALEGSSVPGDLKLENLTLKGKVYDNQVELDEFKIVSTRSNLNAYANIQLPAHVLDLLSGQEQQSLADAFKQAVANVRVDVQTPGIRTLVEAKELRAGSGSMVMSVKAPQVQETLDWLGLFPWMPDVVKEFMVDGGFEVAANIQQGWEDPVIDAKFETTELAVTQRDSKQSTASRAKPGEAELARIKNTALTIQGRLSGAEIALDTGARFGQYVIELATRAHGEIKEIESLMRFNSLDVVLKGMAPEATSGGDWLQAKPILGASMSKSVDYVWNHEDSRLDISPGVLEMRLADRQDMASTIHWGKTSWQDGVINSQGTIDSFPALWLLTFAGDLFDDLELGGDMMLGGQWDIRTGKEPRILLELAHTGGELTLESSESALISSSMSERYQAEINAAFIKLRNEGQNLKLEFLWDTARAGIVSVNLATRMTYEDEAWTIKDTAPLSGSIIGQLPELNATSVFFPTGWRMGGAAIIDTQVSGTISKPELKGKLTALGVSLRSIIDGISFADGEMEMTFDRNEVRLNHLVLKGEREQGGEINAKGHFIFPQSGGLPVVELSVALKKFEASIHRERQLTLSGDLVMGLRDKTLSMVGGLNVDRALIIIDGSGAPSLDDDVVVMTKEQVAAEEAAAKEEQEKARRREEMGITPHMDVKVDLGRNFRVQGFGLQTYLDGELALSNSGWDPMLIGTINTTQGRFKAYGQHLVVERGKIVFSGNPTNPTLDVLAIRPNTQERVGVNIVGTATHPNIRLYSASGLSESETLSWLIFGRSSSSDGKEMAVLQQAALALASGQGGGLTDQIAEGLGLDEISLGGGSAGSSDDSLGGTTLTIGKRLSDRFYITYEQGLQGAMGTFFVFYDISRRLTLRAQTGENTALDLIYKFRFDGGKK